MKITSESEGYLKGSSISSGAYFQINWSPPRERNSLLVALAKGKRVLHMGCADHISLLEKKREQGRYLHGLLAQSAEFLAGTDINREALMEMEKAGISGDLYHVSDLPSTMEFDILLVPDVIEHVGDVEIFLRSLNEISAEKIVITTPNAFRLRNRWLFKSEFVNTDHKYWFSPYTLSKSLYDAGYIIEDYYYTDKLKWWQPLRSFLKWCFPLCRDGLTVVICRA